MKITHKTIKGATELVAKYSDKITIRITFYYKDSRNGFSHCGDCYIHDNGKSDYCEGKIFYLNRTWESYRYQSLIHKLMRKCKKIDSKRIDNFIKKIDDYATKNCVWGW